MTHQVLKKSTNKRRTAKRRNDRKKVYIWQNNTFLMPTKSFQDLQNDVNSSSHCRLLTDMKSEKRTRSDAARSFEITWAISCVS